MFAEQPSEEADLREAEASGGVLGASRKEVWLAHCLSQAIDVQGQVFRLQKALDKAEERLLSRTELPHFMLQVRGKWGRFVCGLGCYRACGWWW